MKRRWLETVAEVFFPRRCPFCGEVIGFSACEECAPYVKEITRQDPHILVADSRGVEAAAAPYWYASPAREAVLRVKMSEERETARALAKAMCGALRACSEFRCVQAIVPVPSSLNERRKRGYDVPLWLAEFISQETGLPVLRGVLVKTKETKRQMTLDGKKRRENLKNAFRVLEPEQIRGMSLLVVDDVYTTGSTMLECALTLRAAGAKRCFALTATVTK